MAILPGMFFTPRWSLMKYCIVRWVALVPINMNKIALPKVAITHQHYSWSRTDFCPRSSPPCLLAASRVSSVQKYREHLTGDLAGQEVVTDRKWGWLQKWGVAGFMRHWGAAIVAFGTLGLCASCLAGPVLWAVSWPAAVVAIMGRKVRRSQEQKLVAVFQAHLVGTCWNAKMAKVMTKALDPCSSCRRSSLHYLPRLLHWLHVH